MKSKEEPNKDGFVLNGFDRQDHNVEIKIVLENLPKKFKISGGLEKLVGKELATKQEIVFAIWEYIKVSFANKAPKTSRQGEEDDNQLR